MSVSENVSSSDWYQLDEVTRLTQQNQALMAELGRLRQELATQRAAETPVPVANEPGEEPAAPSAATG